MECLSQSLTAHTILFIFSIPNVWVCVWEEKSSSDTSKKKEKNFFRNDKKAKKSVGGSTMNKKETLGKFFLFLSRRALGNKIRFRRIYSTQ